MDQSIVRGNKVDRDSTRHNNMRQRRIINAANSVDPQDYVTRAELEALRAELKQVKQELIDYVNNLINGVTITNTVIDGLFPSNTSIQYKDWTGANQSASLVNSVAFTSHSETFSKGLRKV